MRCSAFKFLMGDRVMFRTVMKKELLSFFRDKNTIIYSIILPIALYPFIFWVMNELLVLQHGFLSDMPSRIGFVEKPSDEFLFSLLKSGFDFEYSSRYVSVSDGHSPNLKDEQLDIIVRPIECQSEKRFEFYYDSSSDRSNKAKERIEVVLEQFRYADLEAFSGLDSSSFPDLQLVDIDLSSVESRSRFILGMILPMVVVIITVMGGMYPSIEVITSERERKTLETTLVAPIKPSHLIAGKFLAVITMSSLAGILNIIAMLLTLRYTLFGNISTEMAFTLPLAALPMMVIGVVLTASSFNALMILVAAFAKDFKEAQSYVSIIYSIGIQPAIVAAIPGIPFNNLTALIPVTNISLFFRSLIHGTCQLSPAAITILSLLIWGFVLLSAAKRIIGRDALVQGLSKKQLKMILFKRFNTKEALK